MYVVRLDRPGWFELKCCVVDRDGRVHIARIYRIDGEHDADEILERVAQPRIRDVVENPSTGRLCNHDAAIAKAGEMIRQPGTSPFSPGWFSNVFIACPFLAC